MDAGRSPPFMMTASLYRDVMVRWKMGAMAQYRSGQISASCGPKSRIQGHHNVLGMAGKEWMGLGWFLLVVDQEQANNLFDSVPVMA